MNTQGAISPVGLTTLTEACPECGSTSHIGHGLCLKCMLHRGLGEETRDDETLESVLDEFDIRDADWRLGNYQILEEIGRGGMGVIYRARQRHSRRIVAIKRILAHHADSRDTLVRFRREAEATASLDHQNILPIYEVGEGEDGLPFFSMKFAGGGNLLENRDNLRTDLRRAVTLMAKVGSALQYAHSRGILHRDLKPANILLEGRGEPLVSDFGLAKWLDESSDLTRTLMIFGTPGYIAPEQANGPAASLKPTADIYSLGAILFDLLAGRPPFLGEHALSVIKQAAEKPAPKLRSIVPKIDRDLETICSRCLEREPKARYQSAGHLAQDLERWLEGRPIVARPVAPATRTWRWAKRNPKLAASVAGCVVGGVVIALFSTFALVSRENSLNRLIPEKSIAVLPFQNLSDEKENAYFAEGVQGEILNDLAKLADLKVISRTSVMQYSSDHARNLREVAGALGVAHVVEGTVQRIGDRVRVTAQLIDARTDMHLWAEHYDREVADVFAIQTEIAQTIADRLQAQISPLEKEAMSEPPTTNLFANKNYLKAIDLEMSASPDASSKAKLLEAATLLEEAIKQDPHFLLAYCLLSRVHLDLYFYGLDHSVARRDLARVALEQAGRTQPEAGEVHLAAAAFAYYGFRDYERARVELEIAGKTLPNSADLFQLTGLIDRRQGRWADAIRNFDRAVELDPRNSATLENAGGTYQGLRRYSNASALFRRALEILPREYRIRTEVAQIPLFSAADIRPLNAELGAIMAEDPNAAPKIASPLFLGALMERDRDGIKHAIASIPSEGMTSYGNILLPPDWYVALAARLFGDESKSKAGFEAVQGIEERRLRDQNEYAAAWSILGLSEAALGRKKEAVEHARRACELLPVSKDALDGPVFVINLALVYEWVGDKDGAIRQLEAAAQMPFGVTYGDLKLHPRWDALRHHPGFEKIEASLAPK